jgi:hypothetical protein
MILIINLIAGVKAPSIAASRYFVILLFSLIISITNIIFEVKSLKAYIKFPVHYAILFLAFYVVFANGGVFKIDSAADFLVIFIAFSFFYVSIATIAILVMKSVKKLDSALPQKQKKEEEKKNYSPRFK